MKKLFVAWAVSVLAFAATHAQQAASPTATPSPQASPAAGADNAPKMRETVDLSEPARAENMEIPAPPDSPDPAKSEEIAGLLPDEEKAAPTPPVTGKVEVTAADAGKVVRAAVGNLVAISLQSNPSTGYNWELRDFDYGVADFYKSETVAADSGNVLFGAPTRTIITLQAVKTGTQDIKLVYRRQWEPPDQVAETLQFRLQVDGTPAIPAEASSSPAATPNVTPAP